jgi:hypothetical protein
MKHKIIYFTLVLYSMATVSAMAADWVPFFKNPNNDGTWHYEREGVYYFREKDRILGLLTTKDKDFPKIWFKSVQPGRERRLVIEMDCIERSGRLYDDMGNVLYLDKEVDFMFGHQFRPDSVLDALHREVCLQKSETEKGQKDASPKFNP